MAYCTIANIKRVLRVLNSSTDNQHKIRFSDSYTLPEAYSTNTGTGVLTAMDIASDGYAGSEFWWIKFSSSTAFTLYRGEGEVTADGTGVTSAVFISTSALITIATTYWSGTPAIGDKFKFRTDSNVSNDDISEFIGDADAIINGILNKKIDSDDLPLTTVPDLIERASTYLSANLVFSSVFSNINMEDMPGIIKRWYSFGQGLVDLFMETIDANELKKYAQYARFVARESLFDKIGIEEVAGIEGLYGERETVDVDYDQDYNSKESIGAT